MVVSPTAHGCDESVKLQSYCGFGSSDTVGVVDSYFPIVNTLTNLKGSTDTSTSLGERIFKSDRQNDNLFT